MNLYLEHFGLREPPFKITPTTDFFYKGGRRGEILNTLQYSIESGEGIMMVTGEVGSGKTMLLRTLADNLPKRVELAYIANPSLSGREILYNICEELGLDIDVERPNAVRLLQEYLVAKHSQGMRVVVFIDEAQAMPDESLEEIRLLSNLETDRNKLMQVIMFGQPELLEKLAQQNMRQLRDRITVSIALNPFNSRDVQEYIAMRLRAAGHSSGVLFSVDSCKQIANVSQGLSRRINVLADKALLSAFERRSDTVTTKDVQRAISIANFSRMEYRSNKYRPSTVAVLATALVIAITALVVFAINSRSSFIPSAIIATTQPDNTPTEPNATQATIAVTSNADVEDESLFDTNALADVPVTNDINTTDPLPVNDATTVDIAAKARADAAAYVEAVVADVYPNTTYTNAPETAGLSFEQLVDLQELPPSEQLRAAAQVSREVEEQAAIDAQIAAEQKAAEAEAQVAVAAAAAEEAQFIAEQARQEAEAIAQKIVEEKEAKQRAIEARRRAEEERKEKVRRAEEARKEKIRRAEEARKENIRRAEEAQKEKARRAKEAKIAAEKARQEKIRRAKEAKVAAEKARQEKIRRAKEAKIAAEKARREAANKASAKLANQIDEVIQQSPGGTTSDSDLLPSQSERPAPILLVQSSNEQLPSLDDFVLPKPKNPVVAENTQINANPQWNWMPQNSYLRRRLIASHKWLQQNRRSPSWTARLMSITQTRGEVVEQFLRNFSNFYPLRNVMVYPAKVKNINYFVVTFGVYKNRNETATFINGLPAALRKNKPLPYQIANAAKQSTNFWRKTS